MIKRCENKNAINYSNYGQRGISVCAEWHSFPEFEKWALDNGYSDLMSIDRINPDGSYSPDNCRWATFKTQVNNKTNNVVIAHNGEEHTLAEWSEILNIPYKRLHKQVRVKGMSLDDIINNI